jgi:hypothetical protein
MTADVITDPLKIALGCWLVRWYGYMVPTTTSMAEFLKRGVDTSILYAPDRMVDEAESMLAAWFRNDTEQKASSSARLPVVLVAVAKDYTPIDRGVTRQVSDQYVRLSENDNRVFKVRTLAADFRAQICIFSHDAASSRSIAAQLSGFMNEYRGFESAHTFAGIETRWPVVIESPEGYASNIQTEAKNLSILAVDLTLKATIPLYSKPGDGHPNDGSDVDPGYPVVTSVDTAGDFFP